MKNKNIEIRSIQTELSAQEGKRVISGLAIPVNSKSELLYDRKGNAFYETISPFAVQETLIKENDIKVYMNHDASQGTFARSKYGEGSLKLFITERGLEFEFEAPITAMGDVMIEGILRGDYDAISFAFISNEAKEEITLNADGTYNRVINEILWLDEISVLSCTPAYSATDVDVRSLDNFIENRNKEIMSHLDDILEDIEKNSII